MINIDDLFIVNYCHPYCAPFKNIMRLPKEQAFALAYEMAENNKDTTAFYRFADFENYYPGRMKVDQFLYDTFISLGGKPANNHPLSFVLQGSEYLDQWFDQGTVTRIPLKNILSEFISFTYGDSMSVLQRTNELSIITKEKLLESINNFKGTLDDYMKEITEKHYYIEVQLWNDDFLQYEDKFCHVLQNCLTIALEVVV